MSVLQHALYLKGGFGSAKTCLKMKQLMINESDEKCVFILCVYCTPASLGHVPSLQLNSIQSSYWNPRSGILIHKVWMDFRLNRIINT